MSEKGTILKAFMFLLGLCLLVLGLFYAYLFFNHAIYVIGGNYVVGKGETLRGDLVVVCAQVMLEEGAQVNGRLIALSSDVEIRGTVGKEILSLESNLINPMVIENLRKVDLFDNIVLIPELVRWDFSFESG
jgi:hypothetical protein